ncbi:MAG: hypothetical protein HXN95_11365 [Prevotella salivae]|jgi:hypothetical protein|uniref:hypothetical protein n=1 Tax=Segatella salivae TaxID=228604 RepID=UPI001CB5F839|nr:hypothetical protein [Segatella salivae]MBF1522595.1 hypothetical protein [Segatella salivae]
MNKAIKTEKKFEFFLGLFFLIPPILGVLFFLLNLCDVDGDFVGMRNLSGQWDWHDGSGDGSGASMSPAPLYLGLMAIAGVLLVKNSLRYLVCKNEDAAPTTNETKEVKATEPQQAPKAANVVVEDSNINEALGL